MVREIKATDLVEHSIDLEPGTKPVRAKMQRYTQAEQQFPTTAFPDVQEANKPVDVRIMHNFIPINKWSIRSSYPVHRP